jgi:predicted ATPase
MVAAVQALNAQLAQRHGVRIAVRIGIHTGLVVVGDVGGGNRHEQLALGDTPNLAARLQGLAAPDTVVLSAATLRLVQGYFTAQDLGAQTLKGVAAPVPVYRILGESGAQSRLEAIAPSRLTPLVGREEEVALLQQRWAQARAGQGQVVLLSGEAGIGKSRLVQVLKDHVAHESHARTEWRGSAYHQQSALYPVIMQLQRLLRWQEHETSEEKLRTLETTLAAADLALPEVVPLLAALLSLPLPAHSPALTLTPQRQRQQTLEALLAWLSAEARRQPVLVIVEDLHWIDPSTLELLSLLIDQAASARLCLVLTTRPELRPPWPMVAHLTALTLRRFAPGQITRLAAHVAGDKTLPPAVLEEVVRKTDGVPLFVEELTKVVLESGLLQEQEDRYDLTGPLPPLAIPATLHDALMARLDRLAAAKLVAQLGATIGRTFAYDLVQAVTPLDAVTLQGALAQLVEAELVAQYGMPPQATYMFKHALIQDAAYQSLLRSRRQQVHQRIAQVLETAFPETVATQPELLAQHYTEANLRGKAIGYWLQAGQRANQHWAYAEAVTHLTKGLEILATLPDSPEHTRQELDLQCTMGPALMALKGFAAPETEQTYTRAWQLCQQIGDTPHLLQILAGLERFYRVKGALERSRELGEQLLQLAQSRQDPGLLLIAHQHLGTNLLSRGELLLARAHFEQCIVLYGSQRHYALSLDTLVYDPMVTCFNQAAVTLWALGYPNQGLCMSHEALALAKKLSHPFTLARALVWAAMLHTNRREVQATEERAESGTTLAREHGFAQWAPQGAILHGWALAMQGQAQEGLRQMRQELAAHQATGAVSGRPWMLTLLAEVCEWAGQTEEGLQALDEAIVAPGERITEAERYRLKGQLLLRQAAPDEARAETCFQHALAIARRQQAKSWELRAAMSLARLWQHQGKHVEARELLAPVYGWFTEGFDTADLQEAKALLDALA